MKKKYFIINAIIALSTIGCSYNYNEYPNKETIITTNISSTESYESTKNNYLDPLISETVSLVRVVDGDTIIINQSNTEYYVRLIGINTPESVSPDESKNCEEGKIASDYLKSILKEGQVLYLQKDVSNTDKYGRLLRYVWIELPESLTVEEVMNKSLNGILIRDGYAQAVDYKPDILLSKFFHQIENY